MLSTKLSAAGHFLSQSSVILLSFWVCTCWLLCRPIPDRMCIPTLIHPVTSASLRFRVRVWLVSSAPSCEDVLASLWLCGYIYSDQRHSSDRCVRIVRGWFPLCWN